MNLTDGCDREIMTRKFNDKLVSLLGKPQTKSSPAKRPKDGIQTTTIIWPSASITRAVFSFLWDFKDTPSEKNNWLLDQNPWLVMLIATPDPDYSLPACSMMK